mmetsp:Transcript_20665/g.48240  ORF Transcript_20665/g.48240 Transcript_20665/m.48240 type:complete len:449 (+) Transcript_20665:40-1386(+)
MQRLPSPSQATCLSEAKLLRKLQHRAAAKSRDLTPIANSTALSQCSFSTRNSISAKSSRLSQSACGPPVGVSAAFLVSCLVDVRPSQNTDQTTRAVAALLRLRREEANGALRSAPEMAESQEIHPLTGGPVAGPCSTHVAHAWDASFQELVDCLVREAGSDLDRRYSLDVFGSDHLTSGCETSPHSAPTRTQQLTAKPGMEDSVSQVQARVHGAKEVLLVVDSGAVCLTRLWVLAESMMAVAANKLRVCSADPQGYGSSVDDILKWESRIDAIDWSLAEASRKSDERRLRTFSERVWDMHGIGNERLLAQLKVALRKEVYGQILIKAVESGDWKAIEEALSRGASLEQRDADGNTLEDLACFCNHQEIEEMLFERRMRGKAHRSLSSFFSAEDLVEHCADALPDVLMPFMTQPEGEMDTSMDVHPDDDDDEATWRFLASFESPSPTVM